MIADRYQRGAEIGRGGMGAVWLGRDTVLGRDVALKRIGLMPGATSPDLERADREARLAARLNHQHVVAVYDLVTDDDDTWLVMEYVQGVTLSALIARDGALTPDQAAPLIRQAADALAAAHQAGIVHRDVKPSNMIVTPEGEVKITDFGIARARADASLTQTGLVTGSPAYLSPEVASGATARESSDVWSLGATLFHALAGRPPYDVSENLMGGLYRIVHEEPPRPENAGWLTPVLEHTMARSPDDRWTMQQVRDFLDPARDVPIRPVPQVSRDEEGTRVLAPQVPEADMPAPPPRAAPPIETPAPASAPASHEPAQRRRRPVWPWVAAVVLLAAVGVLGYLALTTSNGDSGNGPQATGSSGSGPSSPHSSQPSTPRSADQAKAMEAFITGYLSTVTQDEHRTFDMLTPAYQQASNGFGGYHGFWKTVRSASPRNIQADPQAMTVSYDVDYVKQDGSTATDHVTLDLVKNGSSYLISGEA